MRSSGRRSGSDDLRMSSRRLHIGLSAGFMHPDDGRPVFRGKTLLYAEESMLRWVADAGALPVLVPRATAALPARDIVRSLDGLILQGGSDVSPRNYGEEPVRPEWGGDPIRDAYEMELFRLCLEENRPVLGVCRGLQVMNVALGGSLYQDIPTLHPGHRVHRDGGRYDRLGHELAVEPGSWLASWCRRVPAGGGGVGGSGGGSGDGDGDGDGHARFVFRVNTVHHQAIKQLGRDLIAEARSVPDGIVEAIRYAPPAGPPATKGDAGPFAYGVQWHPEFMRDVIPDETPEGTPPGTEPLFDSAAVLQAFFEEVQRRRASRSLDR